MSTAHKIVKILAIALAIFIISLIAGVILFIIALITNIDFITGKQYDYNKTFKNIEIIEIDTAHSNIYVKEGEKFEVEAENVTSKFTIKEQNGILKIQDEKNWLLFWKKAGDITIYIPETILKKLDVESSTGKIYIENINTQKLEIDQGTGVLEIDETEAFSTEISGGIGEMNINDSILNNLELDTGIGNVNINSYLTGTSEIECGIGNIRIKLQGEKEQYMIKTNKGIGDIKINDKEYEDDKTIGSGENKIKIEGGIGKIVIDFEDKG